MIFIDFSLAALAFILAFLFKRYYIYAAAFLIWSILDWFVLSVDMVIYCLIFSLKELFLVFIYRKYRILSLFLCVNLSFLSSYCLFWYYNYRVYMLLDVHIITIIYISWALQFLSIITGGLHHDKWHDTSSRTLYNDKRYSRYFFNSKKLDNSGKRL